MTLICYHYIISSVTLNYLVYVQEIIPQIPQFSAY